MVLTVTLNPAIDKILILDHFEIHKLHRLQNGEQSLLTAGGKGVNVARNLKQLGDEVIASGFTGGHRGHMLCDFLRQEGISTNFIFTEEPTRTNLSILDRQNETLTEINDIGPKVEAEDIEFFLDNFKRLINRVELVVIAGSVPRGVPDRIVSEIIKIARKQNKKTFVHCPPLYADVVLEASPYMFIPDMRSHHELFGKQVDGISNFLETGRYILMNSPSLEVVVFTHRIENVVAITRDKSYIIRPKNLKIVNMLGYGDAYLAGFIHAHMGGKQLDDVLKYASACGLTDVEELYKEITDIDKIEPNMNRIEVEVIE